MQLLSLINGKKLPLDCMNIKTYGQELELLFVVTQAHDWLDGTLIECSIMNKVAEFLNCNRGIQVVMLKTKSWTSKHNTDKWL